MTWTKVPYFTLPLDWQVHRRTLHTGDAMVRRLFVAVMSFIFSSFVVTTCDGGVLFYDDFEDGILAPGLSVSSVGTFINNPGVNTFSGLDGSKAFGFGLSTAVVNAFDSYQTTLTLVFAAPTFVNTVSYIEEEAFGNWGSEGAFYVLGDNIPATTWPDALGRTPVNDLNADSTFRTRTFAVNAAVTSLNFHVWDITDSSEIYLDDLLVTNDRPQSVPEPSSLILFGSGLASVFASFASRRAERETKRRQSAATST